jgi:hypothetical protein
MRLIRHWKPLLFASALLTLMWIPAVAHASVTGGCTGSVVIDGTTYTPANDSAANPIVVPIDKSGVVATWEGSVPFANTNHHGSIGIVVGPWDINIADWGGANPDDTRSANGTYSLDEFKDQFPVAESLIPRGLYELSGTHTADGGTCNAHVMVKIEGNPLSSPLGIATVAGTVITGLTLLGSAFRKGTP